jgi:hypothetical protein
MLTFLARALLVVAVMVADWFVETRACTHKSSILDAACSMSALHPTATEYRTLRKV